MSTIRNPVGPQPPGVYWKRRALVLLGVLAIVVVIILIVVRPGGGTPTSNTTKPSSTATSSTDTDTDDPKECDPANVTLTAVTDKGGYNAGEQPLISMSITNTGSSACTINAGTDAQEYIITSGSDQIWSSRDCQTDPKATVTTLEPGVAKSTAPFPWDRTRSATTTCDAERAQVAAGGASYHLTVKLGDIESAATKQFLLY
jgi:hypothetical protein